MAKSIITFQILEGIDKGRIFRELPTPVTIGREEGNVLRLNDERVSRFHAKVQLDDEDYILTDLESTNGTRVNGSVVQIRRLRYGDRVAVGRSILLFGSNEDIADRMAKIDASPSTNGGSPDSVGPGRSLPFPGGP
jgi:pSer/pThr/pTyr-binding forkhead associated (FHA) protein